MTAKAGNPNVTPNMFFAEVDRMMGHWDSMQPNIQKEAMLAVANMAVAASEHGSELAKLRTEAKFAALEPLIRFQHNVLSSISASNAVVVAGAKKMAEGAVLLAEGMADVANRLYKQGLEKIEKGMELCAQGAAMVAKSLTEGYVCALVGVEGAAETVVKALDAFVAACTKSLEGVRSLDLATMSHEQIMNAVTNTLSPVTGFLNAFGASAKAYCEATFTKEAVTATLSSVYNAAAKTFDALVNGFDAASRGMDLSNPVQAQDAAKNVSDLSNTLETHVNDPAHRDVMQRATNALSDLSGKLTDSKSADLAAKVDQAALKDVSAAFVDAVNSVQQDGQMASLNQNEVQAAQGQQQGGGRGR